MKACAHRYKMVSSSFRWGLGQCLSLSNSLDEEDVWVPCEGKSKTGGHNQYGFCQAGVSSSVSPVSYLHVVTITPTLVQCSQTNCSIVYGLSAFFISCILLPLLFIPCKMSWWIFMQWYVIVLYSAAVGLGR